MNVEQVSKWLNDPWGSPIANDIVEHVTKKINESIKQAEKAAFEEGQREMRERAAEEAERHTYYESGGGDAIRALPLALREGKEKADE